MGAIRERIADLAARCGDLSPLKEPVQKRLWWGNRETVVNGLDPQGRPVAPLAPSTLKNRKGDGPPRDPQRDRSRIVRGCVVDAQAGPGRLTFTKSYPSLGPVAEYLHYGTRRMPARPFMDFRQQDLDWVREQVRGYITDPAPGKKRRWWPFGGGR